MLALVPILAATLAVGLPAPSCAQATESPALPAAVVVAAQDGSAPAAGAPGRLRVATFNAGLGRRGPGLLLHGIRTGRDTRARGAAGIVAAVAPDILLLTGIDYDHGLAALAAFAALVVEQGGPTYPYRFAFAPNRGVQTGHDMDGDGRRGTPDDAQGYGAFAGAGAMAILSVYPVMEAAARDFSGFLWRDLPGALIPEHQGLPFPDAEAFAIQRLSSTGHWDVPVELPDGSGLHLLAFHATPPAFGGPHERNRRRNHDEVRFWSLLLDGALPMPAPTGPLVLFGDANLDPEDGDGLHQAIRELLARPFLQDPAPRSEGALAAVGPRDAGHRGDPALDTTLWDGPRQPGNLRVDYVLPSAGLVVLDAGVFWPGPDDPQAGLLRDAAGAEVSRHRLVWVDIALP